MSTEKKAKIPESILVVRIQPGVKEKDLTLEHFDVFDVTEHANFGKLGCWSHMGGGAGEASMDYYHLTKKPKGPEQEALAKKAAQMYHQVYSNSVCQWTYTMRHRLPNNYRDLAGWYR